MPYKFDESFIGYPPVEQIIPNAAALLVQQWTTQGFLARAEDPTWGPGEFILARANGAIRQHGLCVLIPVWVPATRTFQWDATEAPATANMGRPLAVAQAYGAMTAGQFGWFMVSGLTPVNSNASVAAGSAWGIAAAGQGGANVAGRQALNALIVTPATQTVVKVGQGDAGSTIINVPNTDGWFVGAFLSGTGVGVGAVITNIDPMGRFVVASVANSAAVGGNVTATYNNATIFYNVAHLNRVFAQGAIT